MPVVLAHGSLGGYDEVLYLGVAALFVVMMGISWFKSRNVPPLFDDSEVEPSASDTPDHFPLE